MARNIRIVDSPGYSVGNVITPDVEVMETAVRSPYRRRWAGGEPILFILILVLLAIWMYRKNGGEFFGSQFGFGIPASTTTAPPVEIESAPVVPPVSPIEDDQPMVAVDHHSVTPVVQQDSDITGYSRVAAYSLNLRSHPGYDRSVIAILYRDSELAILRQLHVTPNGDVWVEVLADTDQGKLKGWVMQRFLDPSCNCPAAPGYR